MDNDKPVLHLVVIGFHHKKGNQVDYSYPPLNTGTDTVEYPDGWKHLPTLSIPDGSHKYTKDTVFFNLPSLTDPRKTVYGISCYRQIPVEELKIRTADVTRSTVQKAVCALVSRPLYGYVDVKLSLIARSFFDQGDFSNTDIIREAYNDLNAGISQNDWSMQSHIYDGLSIRDIVLTWGIKTLDLFKLMLLQRKVVCFGSPVRPICELILSILSLHPNLLESGFDEVACVRTSRPISSMPQFPIDVDTDVIDGSSVDILTENQLESEEKQQNSARKTSGSSKHPDVFRTFVDDSESKSDMNSDKPQVLPRDISVDALANNTLQSLTDIEPSVWNAPIPIFTNGTLCLPYLSLHYLELLDDPSVNGFVIGTSNILFRQKRQLMDVFINIENFAYEIYDPELRRQISLSVADLRFINFIMTKVQCPKQDGEGSEQWIRKQFQGYMVSLLRTAVSAPDGSKDIEHFNSHLIAAWKQTNGYKQWLNSSKMNEINLNQICRGHPFAGALSMGDVKNKISQSIDSEPVRKMVNQTHKVVGDAKKAFASIWSTLTAPNTSNLPADNADYVTTEACLEPKEITESNNDQIKQVAKNLHNSSLIENGTASNQSGIVEIGREANTLDSNGQDKDI